MKLNEIKTTDSIIIDSSYEHEDLRHLKFISDLPYYYIKILNNPHIKTLIGSPQKLIETFIITNCNNLTSLKGISKTVNVFSCNRCTHLPTLKYGPTKVQHYNCELTSIPNLKYSPDHVIKLTCGGSFDNHGESIYNKHFRSFEGAPTEITQLDCVNAINLDSTNVWQHIKQCVHIILWDSLNEKSPLLGFLRIKKLNELEISSHRLADEASDIVEKYIPLKSMSDIIRCKQELIEAGFKDNARF